MPQQDIKPSDSDDGKPYLIAGWDNDDTNFLIMYAREKGKPKYQDWATVRLDKNDIHELQRFLHSHYGSYNPNGEPKKD